MWGYLAQAIKQKCLRLLRYLIHLVNEKQQRKVIAQCIHEYSEISPAAVTETYVQVNLHRIKMYVAYKFIYLEGIF